MNVTPLFASLRASSVPRLVALRRLMIIIIFLSPTYPKPNIIDMGRRTVCACDAAIRLNCLGPQARRVMVSVSYLLIYLPRRTSLSYYRVKI